MKNRTNVMATPASRRKPLDAAANLAATLAQFTVPKLKDGSAASAIKAQPGGASHLLAEPSTAAGAASASADAGSAAATLPRTADARAHAESAQPDLLAGNSESSAMVGCSAAVTQREAVPAKTPVATPEQVSDKPAMPANSVAPQTQGAVAPSHLNFGSSSATSPVAGHSPAPQQQTDVNAPRSAARVRERGGTPSKHTLTVQPQQPPFLLRRTVTDPSAGVRCASETSPRQAKVCNQSVVW